MMKVIFLDIDGVLNNENTFIKKYKEFSSTGKIIPEIDMQMVMRLKQIVNATGAVIVLSSSWKLGWDINFTKCSQHCKDLILIFSEYNLKIFDKTPNIEHGNRQREIKEWLKNHPETEKFVILDDETTFLMDFVGKQLVKTSILPDGVMLTNMKDTTGLQEKHVKEAIKILEGDQ